MGVGVASGTYSSIFIATPVLTEWKEREPAYRARRARMIEAMGHVPTFPEDNVVAKIDEVERHVGAPASADGEPPRGRGGAAIAGSRPRSRSPSRRSSAPPRRRADARGGGRRRRRALGDRRRAHQAAGVAQEAVAAPAQAREASGEWRRSSGSRSGSRSGTSRCSSPTASGAGSSARCSARSPAPWSPGRLPRSPPGRHRPDRHRHRPGRDPGHPARACRDLCPGREPGGRDGRARLSRPNVPADAHIGRSRRDVGRRTAVPSPPFSAWLVRGVPDFEPRPEPSRSSPIATPRQGADGGPRARRARRRDARSTRPPDGRARRAPSSRQPRCTTRSSSTRWRRSTERIRSAVAAGRTITVHGDYDCDGVCSTAILVRALRELGASCDWYIPDRLGDGYGLTIAGVERLAARGTGLLLTADCGITCAGEVAAAPCRRDGGDRHRPPRAGRAAFRTARSFTRVVELPVRGALRDRRRLQALGGAPAAPSGGRARPRPGGAGDGRRPGPAARREPGPRPRRARRVARRARRPGLRALCAAAGVGPERLDEGDLAFRLARGSTPRAASTAPTPESS